MEVNILEMDNMNPYESFDYNHYENQPHYWQDTKDENETQKRKKITFDDILTNMNVVVNKQGVLQFMTPNQNKEQNQYQQNQYQQNQYQTQNQYQNEETIDPSVKHSYIFNKYFKDYSREQNREQTGPRVPRTFEELKQMLLEDEIRKRKITEVKSKKMLFVTNQASNLNPKNITTSKNNLKKMNFM